MQKQKVIALWIYRNEGGDLIQERLKQSLENKGAKVVNDFDMRECYCMEGRVYTKEGFDLSSVDVLYHMNADEQSAYQSDILRALELSGVKVVNSWNSYSLARNKFWTNVLLKRHGINVPPSLFVNSTQAVLLAKQLFEEWKKIVVKPLSSHGGKGIILFDNMEQFNDFIEATMFESYYIEKFIDFEEHDYRVEILNGKVIYGLGREKESHTYKTNTHSGGHYININPSKEFQEIALKAAKILNIDSTIIDMIKSLEDENIYILEINPIMGIFVDKYQKSDPKVITGDDFARFDEKKMYFLTDYLIKTINSM